MHVHASVFPWIYALLHTVLYCMYVCVRAYVCVGGGRVCVFGRGRCMREGAVRLINRSFLHLCSYVLKTIYLLCYYAFLREIGVFYKI